MFGLFCFIINNIILGSQKTGQHTPSTDALLLGNGPGPEGGKLPDQGRAGPSPQQNWSREVSSQ